VKLRSLGEKFVLLSCDEVGLLEEIVAGNKDLLDGIFKSIVPWDDSFAVGKKFVWIHCRGIPLALWSNQCFESVGSLVGALVEVDNATVTREVVDFARLRVRILVGSDTRMVKQVQINGTFCNVSFEEESEVSLAMQRLLDHQWGRVCEEESEASMDECGEGGSVNSLESELGEGFVSKEGEEETVQLPAEVKGSMLGGDGGAWKNIYCGNFLDTLGGVDCNSNCNSNCGVNLSSMGNFSSFGNPTVFSKKLEESNKVSGTQSGGCAEKHLGLNGTLIAQKKEWSDDLICVGPILAQERLASRVGSAPSAAAAADALCVDAGEVAGAKSTRTAAACGDSGGWSARLSEGFSSSVRGAAFSNDGVLYVDLCAAVGGNPLLTSPSKLRATVGDGGGNMGRSGGDGGSEGVGSAYGREEEAGKVVADSKRPVSGGENAVLVPGSSNSGANCQMDGSLVSGEFNRAPIVRFGGIGAQFRAPFGRSRSADSIAKYDSKLNWLKNKKFEAFRMWSIGKELGFSFNGDEEIVISKLMSLENRDGGEQKVGRKERSVSDDEDC